MCSRADDPSQHDVAVSGQSAAMAMAEAFRLDRMGWDFAQIARRVDRPIEVIREWLEQHDAECDGGHDAEVGCPSPEEPLRTQ